MDSTRLKRWAVTVLVIVPLWIGFSAAPVHASVAGDTININWNFPTMGTSIFSQNVVVPGSTFVGLGVGTISIGDGVITLQNDTLGWTASSGFNGFIFTDTTEVPNFTSFNLVSIGGFPPPTDPILSFNADQLIVNFNASSSNNVGSNTGQLYTFSFTAVPEPATLLLFGTGIMGLMASWKRSKQS